MKSKALKLLSSSNRLLLIIESLVETVEMYNYGVRFFGTLNSEFLLPDIMLDEEISFAMRLDLYDESPMETTNGTCVFFDELSQEDINIFLEVSETEQQRLVLLIKEILNKSDSAKFILELESADPNEIEPDIHPEGFPDAISRKIINIKLEVETGSRRNYFL